MAHCLGVLGRFTVTFRPDTCWKDMTRNSLFSRFMAVFMSYSHSFMVLGLFKATLRPDTCLRVMPKNSSFLCFMVIFMSYCPQFMGFSRICKSQKNLDMFERYDQKLAVLAFYGRFHELLPTV